MNGLTNKSNNLTPSLFADILKGSKENSVSEPMAEIINTYNDYNKQKISRENNLIIFGLANVKKENMNEKVMNLLKKLNSEHINFKNTILLMKKDDNNTVPPVKITLNNQQDKFQILKSAKLLREINKKENSNISINLDLNEIDRQLNRNLVKQKKILNEQLQKSNISDYYYGIRGNKVVKLNK